MTFGMSGRSTSNVASFLMGIDFPASKDDLVSCAEDNNAPQEIIDVLEQLPDQLFSDVGDVMSGVGQVE